MPKPSKPLPPVHELAKVFDYDDQTGILRWKERPLEDFATVGAGKAWNARLSGTEAGSLGSAGYLLVGLNGKFLYVHRICFALAYWFDPGDSQIDHIDGDKTNNRALNLRPASNKENNRHLTRLRSTNTSGFRGVIWAKRDRKWYARIEVDGQRRHLGSFDDVNEAAAAAAAARRKHYGDFDGVVR